MTPGIKFHRGVRQLRLEKRELDDALDFPADFKFKKEKHLAKFFKNFVDDVTRFDEKVAKHTKKIYKAATSEISTWILSAPESSKNQKTLSVFTPEDENVGRLRTALVQCNFTDISRLIRDFRKKMLELETEDREIRETIITENDAIHEIIDEVSSMLTTPTVTRILIIQQFESLRPHFLDSLISLLYSNDACRSVMSRLRLMVCVSTSPALLTQNCEMETKNLMELKQFKFTQLDEVFVEIISTGIHEFFRPPRPAPKNIEEDDPKLLSTYDCQPALFSGPFMKYLKHRFLACDYSVSSLTRAIRFALLRKYIEDPLWREDPHTEEMEIYNTALRVFLEEFGQGGAKFEFAKIHMEIQWNPEFWSEMENQPVFIQRKQNLMRSKANLVEFCERILEKFSSFDEEFAGNLQILMQNLEKAYEEESTDSKSFGVSDTPGRGQKMSAMELRKAQQLALRAKQNNPIVAGKLEIFKCVLTFFERILRPYPSHWRNVIGDFGETETLDASDEVDIEKCLLSRNLDEPLSVAWRALLCHRNFKMVPIAEWAEAFLENIKLPKSEAKGAFFAAAGQLEHIGLIRGAVDKKSTNVHILYHPISVVPSL